jgi:hypothetical protein
MPIKLLSKSEVQKAKQNDRALEVAEGLKLSRRVDGLRELASDEEAKLAKYRDATLAEIQKQIGELSASRDSLSEEVRTLRDEKSAGMRDVEKQLMEVTSLRNALTLREGKLDEREKEMETKEMYVSLNLKSVLEEMQRSKMREESALQLHKASDEERDEAKRTLENARKIEERAIAFRNQLEQELGEKMGKVVEREQAIEAQAELNVITAKELSEIRVRLEDQRNTILRSMVRLKESGRP